MDLIQTVERAEPLDFKTAVHVVGLPLSCGHFYCHGENIRVGQIVAGSVDVSKQASGSMVSLEDLSGECLSLDMLRERYPSLELEQACTDWGTCNYLTTIRPWGRLSFGLPRDAASAKCAVSVVMDSSRR